MVGILPKVDDTVDYFNKSTFKKMKKSAVFMNIGRGPTVNEDDLVSALKKRDIAGAVLDVFKKEPLDSTHELWKLPNVLMTPHCADIDKNFLLDSVRQLGANIKNFVSGKPLNNITDKQKGY